MRGHDRVTIPWSAIKNVLPDAVTAALPHGANTRLRGALRTAIETIPLPYAEGAYGYPEDGQTLINGQPQSPRLLMLLADPHDPLDGHPSQ